MGRFKSVALVDDDTVYADSLSRELAQRDIRLTHFVEPSLMMGDESAGAFDLIMIDLNMADTTGMVWPFAGIEVVRAVRNRFGDDVTIWVLTGYGNPHIANSSAANGADGFLRKYGGIEFVSSKVAEFVFAQAGAA